jgi:hypothetical protein
VAELQLRMSGHEFAEWMAYYRLEPFEQRADYRMAVLASLLANANRDEKKKPEPYTPKDFMPQAQREEPPAQTMEQQLTIVQMLHEAFGGDLRQTK